MTMSSETQGKWQPHIVRQIKVEGGIAELPAQRQIVTESWNRVVRHPTLCYMEDRDRLLMVVNRDYPEEATLIFSDDHGANWTEPRWVRADDEGQPDTGLGLTANYLGHGKCILGAGPTEDETVRWFSSDYGQTWGNPIPIPPASNDNPWYQWHPYLVDRDPETGEVIRLAETGANHEGEGWPEGTSVAFIRFSYDEGNTWTEDIRPPQWEGFNEVALCRAANGDMVAALRTHLPPWYGGNLDWFCGLGVSISQDDGQTWSEVAMLYTWGRHHASMVTMPNGEIVMTYIVRLSYPPDERGFPQFGIEAIVSRDNGRTWDIGHRFILDKWSGSLKGTKDFFWCGPQTTSTILLPDGCLLTAYGTGYRCSQPFPAGILGPHDIGLVKWRLSPVFDSIVIGP